MPDASPSDSRDLPSAQDLSAASPMMAQYLEAKAQHPDCLLFFRMGDFYEMFFEDAVKAASALDITLTRRGQHAGEDIPMAGVPAHAHESYLARLIRQGFRVAICDQVEDPATARKRGGKSIVRREVTRVVTPGTVTEEGLLEARAHNYLAALAEAGGQLGLAAVDITTGDLMLEPVGADRLPASLARLEPTEILAPEKLATPGATAEALADWRRSLTLLPGARFDSENARARLQSLYGVGTLDAFGSFSRAEIAAAGALVDYIDLTQKGRLPRLSPPRPVGDRTVMAIDPATRRNLELTRTLSGERRGSLLATIDRTLTGAGARLLAAQLSAPLVDPAVIERRLDAVQFLVEDGRLADDLSQSLRAVPDAERALSRLELGRGGPRDLAALKEAMRQAAIVRRRLGDPSLAAAPPAIAEARDALGHHADFVETLDRALAPDLPVLARDGGFVASGFDPALDDTRALRDESRRLIAELQARYVEASGITGLKIRHNNVLGFYVEVTATHADRLMAPPLNSLFIHRQTLASAVRFTTTELADLERAISEAADRALQMELAVFDRLAALVAERAEAIAASAQALASLDVALGHARLATELGWTRPLVDDSADLEIEGGRHPVVEAALKEAGQGPFVANDCRMDDGTGRLWLLTGPNMAGKSTFLRQTALIAILAQIGAFVPANRARIGIVDRLFSRVGAADDLARGRSTFMVEMVETAAILNQAGPTSLVILDEIGRGTATWDGLSIAWATVEHLHGVNRCRALFATHYHELTALGASLPGLSCHGMRVKEWKGRIVFLHEVAEGAADRSYGIHVAELAGLPSAVVARAKAVLETLEAGGAGARGRPLSDLPLFSAALSAPAPAPAASGPSAVEEALAALRPDDMTPREALEALYRLKRLLAE